MALLAPVPALGGTSGTILGATVTLYGTPNGDAGTVERTGATAGTSALNSLVGAPGAAPTNSESRPILRSKPSNIGVRGSRRITANLSAIFQVESAIGADGNSSSERPRNRRCTDD